MVDPININIVCKIIYGHFLQAHDTFIYINVMWWDIYISININIKSLHFNAKKKKTYDPYEESLRNKDYKFLLSHSISSTFIIHELRTVHKILIFIYYNFLL
jgi:hypothetical protein